jgi:hypothetical protein
MEAITHAIWLKLGIILNFVGTVLIAYSFGSNLESAHQTDRKARKVYLAVFLHPSLFRVGMLLLALGFGLQLLH